MTAPAACDLIQRLIAAVKESDDWIMYPETLPVVAEAEAWLATPEPAAGPTDTLKPCPFCGLKASLSDERLLFVVRCDNCGAVALGERIEELEEGDPEPDWREMRRSAVVAWNKRCIKPATGPTDEELWQAWEIPEYEALSKQDTINQLRAVLARFVHQPPQPIPLSERLPGPEDCDAEGRCWWAAPHRVTAAHWIYRRQGQWPEQQYTHWLPAHALPLPEVP